MNDEIARRLTAISLRASTATPGPWTIVTSEPGWEADWFVRSETTGKIVCCALGAIEDDARFVSESIEDVPFLMTLVESQARALRAVEDILMAADGDSEALAAFKAVARECGSVAALVG